jgi:hypothetical protein
MDKLLRHFIPKRIPIRTSSNVGKPKGYNDPSIFYEPQKHCLSGLPDMSKPFTVLGITTSCDDTGIAVVRSDGVILSNVVHSQHSIHEKFGGVVPMLALAAHKATIDTAIAEAITQAGLQSVADVDAIAVTRGPGLEVCLRVGFLKAKVCCILMCIEIYSDSIHFVFRNLQLNIRNHS